MNKNSVIIIFSILAVGTVLFWVRLSSTEAQTAPTTFSAPMPAASVSAQPADPARLGAILNAFSKNMAPWLQISDQERLLVVAAVIEMFRSQNDAVISNPAPYYVQRINQTLAQNATTRDMSIDRLIMILAVMDYDFDNGQDKDELAKQILGEKMHAELAAARAQAQQ